MDAVIRMLNYSEKNDLKCSKHRKIFGVPLRFLAKSHVGIPVIVTRICEYLLHSGVNSEGIFRISAKTKAVEELKQLFEAASANNPTDLSDLDVHAVAGVLKLFLREVPGGLVSEDIALSLVDIVKMSEDVPEELFLRIGSHLTLLEPENYELLRYLCLFLSRVAAQECINKMSAESLGIIFGPCVFRLQIDDKVLTNQGLANHVMCLLITHCHSIFNDFKTTTSNLHRSASTPSSALTCAQMTNTSMDTKIQSKISYSSASKLNMTSTNHSYSLSPPTIESLSASFFSTPRSNISKPPGTECRRHSLVPVFSSTMVQQKMRGQCSAVEPQLPFWSLASLKRLNYTPDKSSKSREFAHKSLSTRLDTRYSQKVTPRGPLSSLSSNRRHSMQPKMEYDSFRLSHSTASRSSFLAPTLPGLKVGKGDNKDRLFGL